MPDFDEGHLREQLEGLTDNGRAAFAAACVERMLHRRRDGAADASSEAKTMLERLWRHLLGDRAPPEELAELGRRAEELVPDDTGAEEWTPEAALSENALTGLAYALQTAASGGAQAAVWCARQAIEAIDLHVSQRLAVRAYDPSTERAIAANPLMKAEILRQAADVQELRRLDGRGSRAISAIRDRAQKDATVFLGN